MENKHIPNSEVYVRKNKLSQVEWNDLKTELRASLIELNMADENVHGTTNCLASIFKNLINKYMTLQKLTRKEKSCFYKPWLTKGIQKSMNTRDFCKSSL